MSWKNEVGDDARDATRGDPSQRGSAALRGSETGGPHGGMGAREMAGATQRTRTPRSVGRSAGCRGNFDL